MDTTKFYLIASIALCLLLPAKAQQVTHGTLQEAVVFFNGAELTHSAAAPLSKGENEVWIEGLSPQIDRNSLKIKMTGGAVVSSYEFAPNYLADKPLSPAARKLQDSIDLCRKNLLETQTGARINEQLIALLNNGTTKNVSGSDKGMPFDDLVKTMDYFKAKSTELILASSSLKEREAELTQTINRLAAQFNQEALKNNKASGVLKIRLNAPQAANSLVTVSYYTAAAGWTPYYDMNIESTDRPIKLIFKARLRQVTGIDWNRVKLTLSSNQPSRGRMAPTLHPWFLDFSQPAVEVYSRSLSKNVELLEGARVERMPMAAPPNVAADAEPETPTLDNYVTTVDNDLNLSFAIDLPYSIPGNGKEQSVDLATQELHAAYHYCCIPKLDPATYLIAEIPDPEKLNLLSGKATVTYEGSYVGETILDAGSTLPYISLALGVDNRVAVKREKVQTFSSRKMLGSEIEQISTYRITVRNGRNNTVKIVLKDQYPVSSNNAIKVELLKETSKPTQTVEDGVPLAEKGILVWEESLKAGESKSYTVSYSVRYPKGKAIVWN
ncbi:MAG: DUF4139 domain-containing protein [Tannerellaceae bacterium]|jgi:uncharacterized protein (TIGR02231 family)|nr:DUF4139 domain-containing protein [Tannerellaceae bacterium]